MGNVSPPKASQAQYAQNGSAAWKMTPAWHSVMPTMAAILSENDETGGRGRDGMDIPDSDNAAGCRRTKKEKPLGVLGAPAAAALCFAAAMLLYHIPLGSSMAADALHACLAGVAALVCLALWAGRETEGWGASGACNAQAGEAHGIRGPHAGGAKHTEGTRLGENDRHLAVPHNLLVGLIVLLCLVGALVSVAVPLETGSSEGAGAVSAWVSPQASPALFAVLTVSCLGTAVWEEIAFRRLAMEAVAGALEESRARRLMAACVCSAVFAMLHLPEMGAALPTALRAVQVFLFALAMAGLVEESGHLAPAIAAHALYDAICFAPTALDTLGSVWEISASSLMALETSMSGMLASLPFLAPAAALGVRRLLAAH